MVLLNDAVVYMEFFYSLTPSKQINLLEKNKLN